METPVSSFVVIVKLVVVLIICLYRIRNFFKIEKLLLSMHHAGLLIVHGDHCACRLHTLALTLSNFLHFRSRIRDLETENRRRSIDGLC